MRVEESVVIDAPRPQIFDYATEPGNVERFFKAITRWEPDGAKRKGLGARYKTRIRLGSAEVGSYVEVVEWERPGDMAWASITGLEQRGRFIIRDAGAGQTKVSLRLSYQAPGGVLALMADFVSSRLMKPVLRDALEELKVQVEARTEDVGA